MWSTSLLQGDGCGARYSSTIQPVCLPRPGTPVWREPQSPTLQHPMFWVLNLVVLLLLASLVRTALTLLAPPRVLNKLRFIFLKQSTLFL